MCDPPTCLKDPASLCSTQLACLQQECLVTRFQKEASSGLARDPDVDTGGRLTSKLRSRLQNKSVLVLGDSMARHSFNTLVALLRRTDASGVCGRTVIDSHFGDSYVRATARDGSIDHFGHSGVVVDEAQLPHQSDV